MSPQETEYSERGGGVGWGGMWGGDKFCNSCLPFNLPPSDLPVFDRPPNLHE